MAWLEGISSSKTILYDLAKIMTECNKDENGDVDPLKNWELVFPTNINTLKSNYHGRMILKTTTTPIDQPEDWTGPFSESTTMYLEIKKPEFVINPETGEPTIDSNGKKIPNHYYLNMRIFKNIKSNNHEPDLLIPADNTSPVHASEWSKMSWYIDFKEVLRDSLDLDAGNEDIRDGVNFTFIKTSGIYEDLPIQYWILSSNDRTTMVLMGEPAVSFDNYLTSFAYIGKIDSFDEGDPDVDGNFALTTSSSTIPSSPKVNNDYIDISELVFKGQVGPAYDYIILDGPKLIPTLGGIGAVYEELNKAKSKINITADAGQEYVFTLTTDKEELVNVSSITVKYKAYNVDTFTWTTVTVSNVQYSTSGVPNSYNFDTSTGKVTIVPKVGFEVGSLTGTNSNIEIMEYIINTNFTVNTEDIPGDNLVLQTDDAKGDPQAKINNHSVSYRVVAYNSSGDSISTSEVKLGYNHKYTNSDKNNEYPIETGHSLSVQQSLNTQYQKFQIKFTKIPGNAQGLKIYRRDISVIDPINNEPQDTWIIVKDVPVTDMTLYDTDDIVNASTGTASSPLDITDTSFYLFIDDVSGQQGTDTLNVYGDTSRLGVVRDPISGTVLYAKGPQTWGANTATGVVDICMYQTKSGIYFQKHLASFITPEEYLDKEVFNPSRWTNKFHLSPLYVVHGYDGYRGFLKDVVVVDDSSIVHLDDLVVNKDTPNPQYYKYFKIKAPFSVLSSSPNARYGIAIKKDSDTI